MWLKKIVWVNITLLMFGCDERLIKKKISVDNVEVVWYTKSYITSSRDFVSAGLSGSDTIILDCNNGAITDIALQNDTIKIRMYDNIIYSKKLSLGNYVVKIDSASYQDWEKFYHPELYHNKGGDGTQ